MKVQKDENTHYFLVQIIVCLCISGLENCHRVLSIFFLSLFFTAKWSMHLSTFKLTYVSYVPHISFPQSHANLHFSTSN